MSEEEYQFYEHDIANKRQLPYTITVEKIEDDVIYCHNQWGSDIVYRKVDKGYELIEESK